MSVPDSGPLVRLNLQTYNFSVREFYLRAGDEAHWVLDAPYQRGRLWSEEQNLNLIRSLLQGIPIGVIFTNHRNWGSASLFIVDGKQRISAIRDFVEGRLAAPARWFVEADLENAEDALAKGTVSYMDLSQRGRLHFDGSTVAVSESKLPNLEAEADLYLLINFGGVAQTEEDRARARAVAAS